MKIHVMKSQIVPQWVYMHLPDTLGVITGFCQLTCHSMGIIPGNIIFVSNSAVVALFHTGMESGSGSDTAWTGTVGAVENNASRGERVKIWSFYIRMPCISQTVTSELISHK